MKSVKLKVESDQNRIKYLCRQAKDFYARDWMLGTSGNLSIRLSRPPLRIAVTASSRPKEQLTPRDIVIVNARGQAIRNGRAAPRSTPSAETAIHLALYQRLPDCGAAYHVHTVTATALTSRVPDEDHACHFRIERLEMLKGFTFRTPHPAVELPVFPNWPDVQRIAAEVRAYYARSRPLPALLIAHHGLTAWGRTPAEAKTHVELTEFICRYLWTVGATPQPVKHKGSKHMGSDP